VQMKNKHILLAGIGYMFFALGIVVGTVASPYISIVGPICIAVTFVLVFILVRVSQPSRKEQRMMERDRARSETYVQTFLDENERERAKQVRQYQEDVERGRLEYQKSVESE